MRQNIRNPKLGVCGPETLAGIFVALECVLCVPRSAHFNNIVSIVINHTSSITSQYLPGFKIGTKLYCLVTVARGRVDNLLICYAAASRPESKSRPPDRADSTSNPFELPCIILACITYRLL